MTRLSRKSSDRFGPISGGMTPRVAPWHRRETRQRPLISIVTGLTPSVQLSLIKQNFNHIVGGRRGLQGNAQPSGTGGNVVHLAARTAVHRCALGNGVF